jgi:hypothetical protein
VVDHAWDAIPDATSHYATFVWGLEKSLIIGNSLSENPRGIWLYGTAVRDVEIAGNTIVNGGGIYLRTFQSEALKQFDPMYDVSVRGNRISNSDGVWMSYVDVVFVSKDLAAFGTADTGIEIRNTQLIANQPNVTSTLEDYAGQEGFMNLMRIQIAAGQPVDSPMVVGTIFQSDRCGDCSAPFVLGTGAYGTVLAYDQSPSFSASLLTDLQTEGAAVGASTGTVVINGY